MIYLDGTPYRVLSHEKSEDTNVQMMYWLVELCTTKIRILKKTYIQLRELLDNGHVVAARDIDEYKMPSLKAGDKALTDQRYANIHQYINEIYPNYSILAQRGVKKDGLAELARKCGVSQRNILHYLLAYVQSGGTYISVVDKRLIQQINSNYDAYAGAVRGRKKEGISSQVLNNGSLFAIYDGAYNQYETLLNKLQYDEKAQFKPTLRSVYNNMILEHFSVVDEDGVKLLPDNEKPSYDRFYSWVRKNKLHGDTVRRHAVSSRDRRNNNRILVGSSDYGIFNLMEMVEIDENQAPVSLISANPATPNQAIGDGITYVAIDVLTHRIVGASVGFTNNSYEGFLDLMDSMMMSDEENAYIFGVDGVDYDPEKPVFPGCMLPMEIRVDHGAEYTSHAIAENLTGGCKTARLEGVPVGINLVPVAMGSMKGLVERFFGNLHRICQNALESKMGYITGTHRSRHHDEAALTIKEFREIVYATIKLHNNSPIVDYPVTPAIAAAVQTITPNNLWAYFAETRLGGFDVSDEQTRIAARYGLMKRDKVFTLSRKQISYKNTLYWDFGEDENLKFEAIKLGDGSSNIDVRYDPRSVDTLYRADPKSGRIFRYTLAEKRPAMAGLAHLRWPVADEWIKQMRSRRYKAICQKEDARILTESKAAEIAQQAQSKKPEGKNQTENRREYRAVELEALTRYDTQRKNQVFYGDKIVDPATGEVLGLDEEVKEALPEAFEILMPEIPAEEAATITAEPINATDDEDEIIPEIDLTDIDALARGFGIRD